MSSSSHAEGQRKDDLGALHVSCSHINSCIAVHNGVNNVYVIYVYIIYVYVNYQTNKYSLVFARGLDRVVNHANRKNQQ